MSDPTISAWSRESDLLFHLRQLRDENERLKKEIANQDAMKVRQALAKQEQGERGVLIALLRAADDILNTVVPENTDEEIMLDDLRRDIAKATNQPTHPQQRTWVGLTDEERLKLYRQFEDCLESDGWEYEKAIEAKLKQKNGYAEEKNT